MIVLLVTQSEAPKTAHSCALHYAGLEAKEISAVGDADRLAQIHGISNTVLVTDVEPLLRGRGSGTWSDFVERSPGLNLVVTSLAPLENSLRESIRAHNGTLLKEPFDAAAVVAAVHRTARG